MDNTFFNSILIFFLFIWVTILKWKYYKQEDEIENLKEKVNKLENEMLNIKFLNLKN